MPPLAVEFEKKHPFLWTNFPYGKGNWCGEGLIAFLSPLQPGTLPQVNTYLCKSYQDPESGGGQGSPV